MLVHSDNVFRTFLEALAGHFCCCHQHVAKHLFSDTASEINQMPFTGARATMELTLLKEETMSANAVVRARIDEHVKEEATAVLVAMGLTVSDAFRIMLTRVAREKALN